MDACRARVVAYPHLMRAALVVRLVGLVSVAASLAACGSPGTFACVDDTACDVGEGGRCERDGRCSYVDGLCDSGRRYGGLAGESRNECVAGAAAGSDGGSDVTGPPDAGDPSGADAAPAGSPDAGEAAPCVAELLVNGLFDQPGELGWSDLAVPEGDLIVDESVTLDDEQVPANSAPNLVWLAGRNGADDAVYQQLTIPADALGLTLRGRYWIDTSEEGDQAFDTSRIVLRQTNGNLIQELRETSNLDENDQWDSFEIVFTELHAGETVRLSVEADADGDTISDFFYDDLSLEVRTCP